MNAQWWQTILTISTSIGIGAIISSLISIHYQKKQLIFEKKLTKYSNLIDAFQNAALHKNEEARQYFVALQKQVELIGTDEIVKLSNEFYGPNSNQQSNLIRDKLVAAMRKDLKKYY
jgi:hypothetical protein